MALTTKNTKPQTRSNSMKIFTILTAAVIGLSSTSAEEIINAEKKTALYMVSSAKDFVGQGKAAAYIEGRDQHFKINGSDERISLTLRGPADWWFIEFSAPRDQKLMPGIYKNATRSPFNKEEAGIAFLGCGRGCNEVAGEFEILELEYNHKGKIRSFAANFVQKCETINPPLFGSIRYNSIIPIEAQFNEIFDDGAETTLYFTKYDPVTGVKSQPALIREGQESVFRIQSLPDDREGIEIIIEDENHGLWTLDFAAPSECEFRTGEYIDTQRYPFHNSIKPGFDISMPEGGFIQPQGEFKVLKFLKEKDGEIKALALNFIAKNEKGEVIEGAIRFRAKIPVNLENPYALESTFGF